MRTSLIVLSILIAAMAAAQPAIPAACCAPPPAGLTAWWSFDPPGSPSHDTALFDNIATHAGGPLAVPGVVNQALQFGGNGAYALAANQVNLDFLNGCPNAENFVIDMWIRTTQSSGVTTVLDKRIFRPVTGYSVYLHNGRPGIQLANGAGSGAPVCGAANNNTLPCTNETAPPSIADGQWHFLAIRVVRCGPNAKGTFFVDGNIVYTFNPRQGNISNTAPLNIGRRDPAFGVTYFKGAIDELEITKRAMSDAEIFSIYNAGRRGKCKLHTRGAAAEAVE